MAARNAEGLRLLAEDLAVRHRRSCPTIVFDAKDTEQVRRVFGEATVLSPSGIDGLIVCHGMTPRDAGAFDGDRLRETFEVNFLSVAALVNAAAVSFAARRGGLIAAISSVAGDRGRQSNFVYGSAKAALSTYLQGLRNRLEPQGVHVLTIKPGFVDTPMIRGMKVPATFLVVKPDRVAADIERAILRRRDVVYTPGMWRWIMAVIGMIPESVFKRLRL